MSEIELKIEEMPQAYVGKGVAVVDPKIIDENNWQAGQILELTSNKKSHVKLWSGFPEDYGSGIIRIDGLTRYNIGARYTSKGCYHHNMQYYAADKTLEVATLSKITDDGTTWRDEL